MLVPCEGLATPSRVCHELCPEIPGIGSRGPLGQYNKSGVNNESLVQNFVHLLLFNRNQGKAINGINKEEVLYELYTN